MSHSKTTSLILILLSTLLCSCAKLGFDMDFDVVPAESSPPANEATPEENEKIDAVIKRIAKISKDSGMEVNLQAMPILVTSAELPNTENLAYCATDSAGNGKYIALSRKAFEMDKDNKRSSIVFGLLLHEVGHCYFHRNHDERAIEKAGHSVEVLDSDDEGTTQFSFDKFPVSVMTAHLRKFGTPRSLEKYYVAEMLGQVNLQTDQDAENLDGVHFVPVSSDKDQSSHLAKEHVHFF